MDKEIGVRVVLGICAILAVAGCSDPKKASKPNFEKAINAHLVKTPACLSPPRSPVTPADAATANAGPFPAYVANETGTAQQKYQAITAKPFEALVQAGLLKATAGEIAVQDWSLDPRKPKRPVRIYNLTDEGRKAIDTKQDTKFGGKGFCYGTPEVVEIVRYTEPSNMVGMTLTEVNYTYHLKDPAKWATNPAMIDAFPGLKTRTGNKMDGRAELVLTNEGWDYPR